MRHTFLVVTVRMVTFKEVIAKLKRGYHFFYHPVHRRDEG